MTTFTPLARETLIKWRFYKHVKNDPNSSDQQIAKVYFSAILCTIQLEALTGARIEYDAERDCLTVDLH